MVKLISLIVLTHFFQFNELKILRQNRQYYNNIFLQCSKTFLKYNIFKRFTLFCVDDWFVLHFHWKPLMLLRNFSSDEC